MMDKIRQDFPILSRKINGKPLVYLDNAATSQKPKAVLDMLVHYYTKHNANVHRGVHTLSQEATEEYELARKVVGNFVGVKDTGEIIFVKNATEALNLIAYSWGRNNISKNDEIVVTVAEHHSNFVVWQQLARENGAVLKVVPVDENGEVDPVAFKKAITSRTKLVSFFHVSNVLGTVNDVRRLSTIAHRLSPKAVVIVDGAQAVPHMKVDIAKIGCDFYVFTGHKMLGPTGIGVLWGRRELLEKMPPFLFGGDMISKVSLSGTSWNELPWKFEAGTPDAAAAVGLMAAVEYLEKIGMDKVREHEVELTRYAIKKLSAIPEVEIYGPLPRHSELDSESRSRNEFGMTNRAGVISFNVGPIHAHDVASILDAEGIAIRSGHHCAQPLMNFLGIESAARVSFYIYNTKEEVDKFIAGIEKVISIFKPKLTRIVSPNVSEYSHNNGRRIRI
ncbi:MAG: cysteine desulfurase [Candidatus Curtissbacteria bacterium]|nr:cysteine desulfurase [Candidatus Curtissbacteria bacterium]